MSSTWSGQIALSENPQPRDSASSSIPTIETLESVLHGGPVLAYQLMRQHNDRLRFPALCLGLGATGPKTHRQRYSAHFAVDRLAPTRTDPEV
jgi:hypothetical protein